MAVKLQKMQATKNCYIVRCRPSSIFNYGE